MVRSGLGVGTFASNGLRAGHTTAPSRGVTSSTGVGDRCPSSTLLGGPSSDLTELPKRTKILRALATEERVRTSRSLRTVLK
jgi:hypothetical protein